MAKFLDECKNWISLIQSVELEKINISKLQSIKQDAESNKYLFKVLLHLSHCADKCSKGKLPMQMHVYKIAVAVCENLISIPDEDKFFSALYFILAYLLQKQYFSQAKRLSQFLLSENAVSVDDGKASSKYYQLAGLWQTELFKQLDTLQLKSSSQKAMIDEIIPYIEFNLNILSYCNEKNSYTFFSADSYVRKLNKVPLEIAFPCLDMIFKHLSNYTKNLKTTLLAEAYDMSIVILGFAFFKRSDVKNNSDAINYFFQCDNYFFNLFESVPLCSDCYKLFRLYSINLLTTNFMSKEIDKTTFKNITDSLKLLLSKNGAKNSSLIQTSLVISWSFETLFNTWEPLVLSNLKGTTITYDYIVKMGDIVKSIHKILLNREYQWNYVCKQCPESTKCRVKRDIYHASIVTSAYLKVITRANQQNLSEKMFTVAKEILELLISALTELEQHGCKYSSLLWEICGRMIFNFGLISETKYAAHLEGLYKTLCKKVVFYDGLSAKISSFGLENPVGTSLHRMCNIYFNRAKYREAMTYAAYNALLSNHDNRKKKACDMWANIKFKTKDSNEYPNFTLIDCLKTDADVVKKLGIVLNLDDYNLDNLCVKELQSLFLLKGDILGIMKQTLDLLESRHSTLEYAQGTLLLCFHAMQFNKREYISDYITKAIEKLKKGKQKTVSNQCLLANLNFFRIIEKLYVRSQVIDKQMEDANFTIKAFKTFKGSEANGDVNGADEVIVPTFGEINVEEDSKLASELREVLNLWESCMLKDMKSITCNWEPKFTLETMVFCGEYCRLYKFNVIEEKTWNLAHKLATAIKDFATCTYVTSRSISLRCINDAWISDAKKYVENNKNSNKAAVDNDAVLFMLSLADFYLDCKKVEEAKVLLDKVKSMPNFSLLTNNDLYIYLTDIRLRNYFAINFETSQEGYSNLMVEIHYLLINSYETMNGRVIRFWNIRYHLIDCEQMFEAMCNLTVPMNCLLSYRDVSLHLSHTLKFAQRLGLSLRIAEIIKYLCYIDLLRSQIDSCETHLQDLEHVLCLDHFKMSSKTKLLQTAIKSLDQLALTAKVRDATASQVVPVSLPKNSGSPELKKKLFSAPTFLEHTVHCQCFFCTNLHYQYLTFSCTHVQAQLFCLLKYAREAEHYFHGACKIKLKIDERDGDEARQCMFRSYQWKRSQKYTVDYLLYLMDFSMFISEFMPGQKDDALDLVEEVQMIAAENDLSKHCVIAYSTELYAQHYIYEVLSGKLNISVPHDITIDITNEQLENCITPKVQIEKTTRNPRRHKSPPVLALPIITISDDSSSESDCGNSPIPGKSKSNKATEVVPEIDKRPKRASARNVRRKILADELDESPAVKEKEKPEPKVTRKKSSRKIVVDEIDIDSVPKEKEELKIASKRSTRLAKKPTS